MKIKSILIVLLATFCANAQNIFQDDFNSYIVATPLNGQGTWTNNSSLAGLGNCTPFATCINATIENIIINYVDYGSAEKAFSIIPDKDGVGTLFTGVTSGDIYIGFVLNLSNAQANNNSDFFRVMSGNVFNTSCRLYATNTPGAFFIGVAKAANGNQINFTSNALNYNQDHLIIIKYTLGTGASDDLVSLYIDPVYLNGQPANATISTNVGLDQVGVTGIDRLAFRQNWLNGMPTGKAGLVSVAKTWEDLTFVSLGTQGFSNSNFVMNSINVNSGILSVKSNITLQNGILNIYDIQGRKIENKNISLTENENTIVINPITTAGIYIVEITSEKGKFSQKIVVQ